MTTTTETREVLTHMGPVKITFDSEGRNRFEGAARAIAALDDAVSMGTDRHGVGVTLDTLQPDDLEFVAGPQSGLSLVPVVELEPEVVPPAANEADEEDEAVAVMDSAGRDIRELAERAYEDYFHKIKATVDFKTWLGAFKQGWEARGPAAPVGAAVTALEVARDTVVNNEPINRAEGNTEQADAELRAAEEIGAALAVLQDGVEELPALRAQFAAATTVAERLRLANAIKAARVAPPAPAPAPVENDATRLNALAKLAPKDGEAITSGDPRLIEKLEAKLAYLLAYGDFMRKANRLFRKGDDAGLRAMGMSDQQIEMMKKPDFAGRTGFPDYMMSNNNGVIGSTRKRLEAAVKARDQSAEKDVGRATYPDGRLIPVVGDQVFQALRGAFGMPASIRGEVYSAGGEMRVRITGGGDALGVSQVRGGTQKLTPAWTVVNDPELKRREDERAAQEAAAKAAREAEQAAQQAAQDAQDAADIAAGFSLDADSLNPGDMIESPRHGLAIVTETLGQNHKDQTAWVAYVRGGKGNWMSDDSIGNNKRGTTPGWRKSGAPVPEGAEIKPDTMQDRSHVMKMIGGTWVECRWDDDSESYIPLANPAEVKGRQFRYALVNRPADFATLPKGLMYTVEPRPAAGQPHHDMARHGILVAERELTEAEVKSFELAPLVGDDALPALAEQVARAMSEYARDYLDQAKDEPDVFAMAIRQTIEQSASGIQYSVGNPALLAQMVRDKLAAAVEAQPAPAPAPTPEPAADNARAEAMALLEQVAAGTHPDMLEPELADKIEDALMKYPDDADLQALGVRAIDTFSNGLMAATN
jgi:hypothetical protein